MSEKRCDRCKREIFCCTCTVSTPDLRTRLLALADELETEGLRDREFAEKLEDEVFAECARVSADKLLYAAKRIREVV